MPRPIWKGSISFGLVNVPVTLYSGERRADLKFHLVDSRDEARVRYQRVNEETGAEVPWDEIVRAYEYDDGDYVLLTDEDFEEVNVEASQTVEIEDFVDRDAIEHVYFDKPYYLVPGKKGGKGYVLLREALRDTNTVGIARVVIRTREYLAAVLPQGNALVLDLLRFKQELRDPSEFDLPGDADNFDIGDKEFKMAKTLVESMAAPWEPERYHDEYREQLLQWIEKKAKSGKKAPAKPEKEDAPERGGELIDFMDLLKQSVDQEKGKHGTKGTSPASKRKSASRKQGASSKKKAQGS